MRVTVLFIALFLLSSAWTFGQLNTIYLSNNEAASQWRGNPAFQGKEKVFLYILPAVSSFDISAGHTGFTYNDAVQGKTVNFSSVIDGLKKKNHLLFENRISMFALGLKAGKTQFRIGMDVATDMRFSYPGELIELLWKGNGHPDVIGRNLDMSGLGLNFISYYDYFIGLSRTMMDDKLAVGANLHYMQGLETIYTKTSEFYFYTDPNDYALTASGAFDLKTSLYSDTTDIPDDRYFPFSNSDNTGMSFDFGATYKFSDRLDLQASALNIGSINWTTQAKSFVLDGVSITYDGLELDDIYDQSDSVETSLENVADSIADLFELDERAGSFKTPSNARYILSADYALGAKNHVQFTYAHMRSFNQGFNTVVGMFRRDFSPLFSVQGGLQFFNFRHLLVPIAFQFNPGPVQLAVGTGNVVSAFGYKNMKFLSGHFSLSLRFGKQRSPRVDD